MARIAWVVAIWIGLCATSFASDDPLVSIGDQKYLGENPAGGKITHIKYPTLGCPTILEPGGKGTAWIWIDDAGSTSAFDFALRPTIGETTLSWSLPTTGIVYDSVHSIYHVTYQVPGNVPEDMYNLHVAIPSQSIMDVQYNSVRIVPEETGTYTFIVVADPQFNDPRGMLQPGNYSTGNYDSFTIVEQMKKEIRALNPTFVIVLGDVTFGMDYDYEYEGAWNTWKDAGFALFMAPGNHDGMATVVNRTFLGFGCPKRDGLVHWRKYFGPNYFSFEFGGVHLQAVNSFDGSPDRRDSFLVVNENHGGDLSQEQMDWIAVDTAGAQGNVVPYMHHSPLGPYRENGSFGMFTWILQRIWDFITTGSFDDFSQTWNTQATADWLRQQYALLPMVFIGHNHEDKIKVDNNTTYRMVTTAGSSGEYWGYTVVKVENQAIVDTVYLNQDFQSIPTGNLYLKHLDPDPHEPDTRKAEILSGLSRSYEVTLRFRMPTASAYEATNGTVIAHSPIDSGLNWVWVRADTPVATDILNPERLEVTVKTSQIQGSFQGTTPVTNGGSGGGCGAPLTPGNAQGHLLLLGLPLFLFVLLRRGR